MSEMMESISVALGTQEAEEQPVSVDTETTTDVETVEDEKWYPVIDDTPVINIADSSSRNSFYIGRPKNARPGQADWGNPFSHIKGSSARWMVDSAEEAVRRHELWLAKRYTLGQIKLHELASLYGKTLGCFCKTKDEPNAPCHGDNLAKAAAWAVKTLMSDDALAHLLESAAVFEERYPEEPFTLAVVGSRNWQDQDQVESILDKIRAVAPNMQLVSGAADGADSLAKAYADKHDLTLEEFEPDWDQEGRSAGFKRNERIWDRAHAGIAFWDGKSKGTRHSLELYQGRPFYLTVDPRACSAKEQEVKEVETKLKSVFGVNDPDSFKFE